MASPLYQEFLRYLLVGGTAFLFDYGLFFLTKTLVFNALGNTGVYLATAAGFITGLAVNYILSITFVFKSAKEQNKGKTVGAFLLFAVIGVIGLLLSEGGMYLFFDLAGIHFMLAKIIVTGIVLLWNYIARKLLIFQ